jgi:hypothetical protein
MRGRNAEGSPGILRQYHLPPLGEAAEKRNSKDSSSTKWGVLAEAVVMKAVEILTRGTLKF